MNREGKFKDYASAIDFVIKTRIELLKHVQKKMELYHKQYSHELQLVILIHNQKLKEESDKVDQLLKFATFTAEERERAFKRKVDINRQQMTEEQDFLEMYQRDQTLQEEFSSLRAKVDREISELKRKITGYQ